MPAYSITDVEVLDTDGFTRYRELAGAAVARYGGRFLVRGAEPVVAEGDPARDIAKSALRRRLLFVEGVDPK